MNALTNLLYQEAPAVEVKPSVYQHGAYICLRHNTENTAAIVEDYSKVYQLSAQLLLGVKLPSTELKTTARVPAVSAIKDIVRNNYPIMVSTIENKETKNGNVLVSHHFLYGTHWHLDTNIDDTKFERDIEKVFKNYLSTLDLEKKNFLIQPVGQKEEQYLDRNTDKTIASYIRYMYDDSEVDETVPDTLLIYMQKLKKPQMAYATHYSFCI